jgi:RNA polymerase sigma-70 factor (ECF subfamily)
MFACCHPGLSPEDQTALALKILCAFSPAEIANAFLTTEAAIAKRLTRAKQKIRDERIPFEIPAGEELARRLDGVLQTLYLLFNEGYKASSGDDLIKEDLCQEAIRLTSLLAEHPAGNHPRTHALVALMLLNAARLPARTDSEGNVLRLKEQDRSAGIAACHCAASDYESTDWRQILSLYDRLLELDDSPVIALNRAVAVANVHGPQAGVEAVEAIENGSQLKSYYLLYAVLGEFEKQLNHFQAAIDNFRKALELSELTSEQLFLTKRLRDSEERSLQSIA